MKKVKFFATLVTIGVISMSSLTAFAAPKTMADGNVFDAEYYASHNPDVVAAFGNSEAMLYKHYVEYGKKEGRLPFDNGKTATVAVGSSSAFAEKAASAFAANDYATVQKLSASFKSYMKELEPYKTHINADGSGWMYNFSTSYGPLMISYSTTEGFNYIVDMALAMNDASKGNQVAQEYHDYMERNRAIRAQNGVKTCSNYVYGVNFFILNDRWSSYCDCKSGYKYMDFSTDGKSYTNAGSYPLYPNILNQAKAHHWCTDNGGY